MRNRRKGQAGDGLNTAARLAITVFPGLIADGLRPWPR